jgi:hypothetical protein
MRRMFAVGRRMRSGLAAAAGGLLAAACAIGTPVHDPLAEEVRLLSAGAATRVQPSSLVTRREMPFVVAQHRAAAEQKMLLVYRPAGAEPRPVAMVSSAQTQAGMVVSIRRLPLAAGSGHFDVTLATLEHLYTLILQQEPEGRYCLDKAIRECAGVADAGSQADALRQIAAAREETLGRASGSTASPAWLTVSLRPVQQAGGEDEVGVLVMLGADPLPGRTVFFHKAPHFGCEATTNQDGLAACTLQDHHPEEHSHAGEEDTAVVVTFPGDPRTRPVLVPTTLVVKAHGDKVAGAHR